MLYISIAQQILHLVFFFPRCAIAELFLDGQPLFEYSQLLAYRRGQYDPCQHLEKVCFLSFTLLTVTLVAWKLISLGIIQLKLIIILCFIKIGLKKA